MHQKPLQCLVYGIALISFGDKICTFCLHAVSGQPIYLYYMTTPHIHTTHSSLLRHPRDARLETMSSRRITLKLLKSGQSLEPSFLEQRLAASSLRVAPALINCSLTEQPNHDTTSSSFIPVKNNTGTMPQPPAPSTTPGYSKTFYKRKLPCPPAVEFSSEKGIHYSELIYY